MLIAGLDEAGRGPVIGPLVVGCVIMEDSEIGQLEEIGVDDSKKMTAKKRRSIATQIREIAKFTQTLIITPADINHLHDVEKYTLNQIEEMHFAKLLNSVPAFPDQIFLDACDTKEERFGETIKNQLKFTPKKVISKHKGDAIFKIVGAASILAKTTRDEILEEYISKWGEVGSGYPSDPKTKTFLKTYYAKHRDFPPIVRTWWKTAQNVVKEYNEKKTQKKLTDF
jgi:ribonuclease HII